MMSIVKRVWLFLLLGISSLSVAQETLSWQALVEADSFTVITAIVQPPHDLSRLFVADLFGTISIIENGELVLEPFLDVSERITTETYAQGLTGMVFHPQYTENGFFYISYTPPDNSPILARYTVSSDNRN